MSSTLTGGRFTQLFKSSLPNTHTHTHSLSLFLKHTDWDKDFDNWRLVNLYWTAPTTESTEMPALIHDSWPDNGGRGGLREGDDSTWLVTGLVYIHSNQYCAPHLTGQTMEQTETRHCRGEIYLNAADILLIVMKRFHPTVPLVSKSSHNALHTKRSQHLSMVKKVTTAFCVHSSQKSCFANQNSTKGCFTLKLGWQFQHIPQKAVKYDCWSWLS